MLPRSVTLVSRSGCHLCDDAREVVSRVVDELPAESSVTVAELSVDDDETLLARYSDEVPVVLIDDRVHQVLVIEPARLRSALMEV